MVVEAGLALPPGAARAVGWKGQTVFAGNRLHESDREERK